MKIKILKGTNQIGGCITEVQSEVGTKVLIDIGTNLPNAEGMVKPEIELEGLMEGKEKYDAILVTHYHGDHIGLYNQVSSKIPIYIGEISKEIFKILQKRLYKAELTIDDDLKLIDNFKTYKIPERIKIKDIIITPIAVDHSAFDAHMFLIECDGKKVLHTGDFRTHGQRGHAVIKAIKKYVGKVDCLICEGTTLTRENDELLTEAQLQRKAEEIFENNKYNFVLCSSTNIDRIAAFHKAAIKKHKMFICDKYQEEVLEYINSISRSRLYKFNDSINTKVYSYDNNLLEKMKKYGFVMLVRTNRLSRTVMSKFPEKTFIYSQWLGYLKGNNEDYKRIQEMVPNDYIYLHTSGHADKEAMKNLNDVVNPDNTIIIHTDNGELGKGIFNNMKFLNDGEIFTLK